MEEPSPAATAAPTEAPATPEPTPTSTPAPIEIVCDYSRRHSDRREFYDPGDFSRDEALQIICGQKVVEILNSCEIFHPDEARRILRGTNSTIGKCYVLQSSLFQFDANTGPCSFLGYFNEPGAWYWDKNYGEIPLGQFGYGPDPDFHWAETGCWELDDVFKGDKLVLAAIHLGPFTYETTAQQYNTVPAFEIVQVLKPVVLKEIDSVQHFNRMPITLEAFPEGCAVHNLSVKAGLPPLIDERQRDQCQDN